VTVCAVKSKTFDEGDFYNTLERKETRLLNYYKYYIILFFKLATRAIIEPNRVAWPGTFLWDLYKVN
jgi:hypothetical protein